jgi:hypothetical protein
MEGRARHSEFEVSGQPIVSNSVGAVQRFLATNPLYAMLRSATLVELGGETFVARAALYESDPSQATTDS